MVQDGILCILRQLVVLAVCWKAHGVSTCLSADWLTVLVESGAQGDS
jgi:hypothetical protein